MSSLWKRPRRRVVQGQAVMVALAATLVMALPAVAQAAPQPATVRPAPTATKTGQTKYPYTYVNPDGTKTIIASKPTRFIDIGGEDLDVYFTFGLKPIGVATYGVSESQITLADEAGLGLTAAQLQGIHGVGAFTTPDYEAIASLKPDLIIVQSDFPATEIQELRSIAPTIEPSGKLSDNEYDWQVGLQPLAAALDVTAHYDEVLARLTQREDALSGFVKGTSVAQISPGATGKYQLVTKDSLLGGVFELAGVKVQNSIGGVSASGSPGIGSGFIGFTSESLPDLTAQKVLFVGAGLPKVAQIEADPLYPDIPAEKTHQVYFTDWFNTGPFGTANLLQQLQKLMYGVTGLEATMKGSGKYATSRTGVADLDVGNNDKRVCWDVSTSGIGTPKAAQVFSNTGKKLFGLGKYKAEGCMAITAAHGEALLAAPYKYHVRINTAKTVAAIKGGLGLASPSFFLPSSPPYTMVSSVGT